MSACLFVIPYEIIAKKTDNELHEMKRGLFKILSIEPAKGFEADRWGGADMTLGRIYSEIQKRDDSMQKALMEKQ